MRTLAQSRTISDENKRFLDEVRRIVQGILPTATVLLYGSVARGDQGPESDYDVLILVDAPMTTREENQVRDAVYPLELEYGAVVSKAFYTKTDWAKHPAMPFHIEVDKDGVIL